MNDIGIGKEIVCEYVMLCECGKIKSSVKAVMLIINLYSTGVKMPVFVLTI